MDDARELVPGADDFTRIPGIGPVIAACLHAAGIHSYAQLGVLAPLQVAKLVEHLPLLSVERIVQQDWIGHARTLAAELPTPQSDESARVVATRRYESFLLELRLDGAAVRHTRMVHLQDGEEQVWNGWDAGRLLRFVARDAGVPAVTEATALTAKDAPEPATASDDGSANTVAIQAVTVVVVAPDERAGLRAEVRFLMHGTQANGAAAALVCNLTVLAYDTATGAVAVLGSRVEPLALQTHEHTIGLELVPPAAGHYQLVVLLLLPDAAVVASAPGPLLRVVA